MTFDSSFSLWPILPIGAEENNAGENSPPEDPKSQDGQQNPPVNNDDEDDDPYKGLSTKELKRLLKDSESKGEAAEAERNSLQEKIAAEERKKNDENTNLKNDLSSANQTITELRSALAEQAIINGILSDNRYEWNNVGIVAQQLDSTKVKVDDKGKVTNLEKELTRIAQGESTKFLLAKDNTQQSNNGNQQQQNNDNNGPTGFQPGQGGAGSGESNGFSNTELAKNYTALASRL